MMKNKKIAILISIGIVAIIGVMLLHINIPIYLGLPLDELNSFQQKAADVYPQAVNLLITLATLLLGGIWIIYKSEEKQTRSNLVLFVSAIASSILILVSLYCGFRSYTALLNQLLGKSFLVVAKSQMLYFLDWQFITFLSGVFFFIFSFLVLLMRNE